MTDEELIKLCSKSIRFYSALDVNAQNPTPKEHIDIARECKRRVEENMQLKKNWPTLTNRYGDESCPKE